MDHKCTNKIFQFSNPKEFYFFTKWFSCLMLWNTFKSPLDLGAHHFPVVFPNKPVTLPSAMAIH